MIVFLLAVFCIAAAKPTSQPGSYVVDGLDGLLYEIPEYEDPELTLFQLSSMGIMPVLTVLQMAKDAENLKKQDTGYYEEDFDDVKKSLDDVIGRLELARSKVEKKDGNILTDIEMAHRKLMDIDHSLHRKVNPISAFIDEIFQSKKYESDLKMGTLSDASSTEATILVSSENPGYESSSYEKRVKTPLGDALLISETNKYQDVGKAAIRKKWTLKSAGIVKKDELDKILR